MNQETINEYLPIRFPELGEEIAKEREWWFPDEVPSHVFYGDILNKLVFNTLITNTDKEFLKRIFDFYEEMAECGDEYVQNLLQVTLLEYLWDDFEVLRNAHKYMGQKTRKLSDELQIYFKPFK